MEVVYTHRDGMAKQPGFTKEIQEENKNTPSCCAKSIIFFPIFSVLELDLIKSIGICAWNKLSSRCFSSLNAWCEQSRVTHMADWMHSSSVSLTWQVLMPSIYSLAGRKLDFLLVWLVRCCGCAAVSGSVISNVFFSLHKWIFLELFQQGQTFQNLLGFAWL